MIQQKASAIWQGGLKDGHGTISTQSDALEQLPYSFKQRFEGAAGTNPEELIGAAHASCFSMAFSAQLGEQGFTPKKIQTLATVTLEKGAQGFEISRIHLDVTAEIPEIDRVQFLEIAEKAKAGCPISKLFRAEISMNTILIS